MSPTLCDLIGGSPKGSSVPGILQARLLEWVAISFSNACMHAKMLQSCLTLCHPIDGSPPGSPVPEILQAIILEWVAISFSTIITIFDGYLKFKMPLNKINFIITVLTSNSIIFLFYCHLFSIFQWMVLLRLQKFLSVLLAGDEETWDRGCKDYVHHG